MPKEDFVERNPYIVYAGEHIVYAGDPESIIQPGVTVEPLTVTENDVYTAPAGKAYSPVTVNVSGGGTVYGYGVNIFPRMGGEPFDFFEGAHVLSEVGNASVGNIMGDLMWFDDGKNFVSYGNVNVGFSTPDNYTATVKVNDGDPQPVSKFFNEEWELYTYAFTVPNVTQEDYVYLDLADAS